MKDKKHRHQYIPSTHPHTGRILLGFPNGPNSPFPEELFNGSNIKISTPNDPFILGLSSAAPSRSPKGPPDPVVVPQLFDCKTVVPKGCKEYSYPDGFSCIAFNQNSADKKHNKYLKNHEHNLPDL